MVYPEWILSRYELGISVSKKDLQAHKDALGLEFDGDEVDYFEFEEWWEQGFGKRAETRRLILSKLATKMKDEYLPHIKKLFAQGDADKVCMFEQTLRLLEGYKLMLRTVGITFSSAIRTNLEGAGWFSIAPIHCSWYGPTRMLLGLVAEWKSRQSRVRSVLPPSESKLQVNFSSC